MNILTPPSTPIPETLFGMDIQRIGSPTPWPVIPFGDWRLWDAHVAWMDLEPAPGQWDFSRLDWYVQQAEIHHVQILLTLGLTPRWASSNPNGACPYDTTGCLAPPQDLDWWTEYVRTVATRYKGRIRQYGVWNEANTSFTGSMDQMIALTRAVHDVLSQIDPAALVISPSATAGDKGVQWLNRFLSAGGGRYVDVIAFHFYVSPEPPESIAVLAMKIQSVMKRHQQQGKPLWNTETGWPIQDQQDNVTPSPAYGNVVLDSETAADYAARAYVIAWAADIQRFYWYAWDDQSMGLVEPDKRTLKPAARAYGQVEKWLTGAHMDFCGPDSSQTWICGLSQNGVQQYIVWNPTHRTHFRIPQGWHVSSASDLSGGESQIVNSTVTANAAPQLLH